MTKAPPAKLQNIAIWAYPLVVWLVQSSTPLAAVCSGLLFAVMAALLARARKVFLLFGFTALGHGVWALFAAWLAQRGMTGPAAVVVGRFGLLGYLLLFGMWMCVAPAQQNWFRWGDGHAVICFPWVWRGREETVRRFVLLFSAVSLVFVGLLAQRGLVGGDRLVAGLLFCLINATLEEILWRGLILPRVIDLLDETKALPLTALAFGLYHLSLGFSLWACLLFAVGGFYMGGTAAVSKGLLAPWVMHLVMNLLFVFGGLIF